MIKETRLLQTFGRNLRRIRQEKGLSQEVLALEAELDRTYISGVERGRRNISLINLYRIAAALKVPAHHLLLFELEDTNG